MSSVKKIAIILILSSILYLLSSISLAAAEERSYLLTFKNSPSAGAALNARFTFSLAPEISPSTLTIVGPKIISSGESWQKIITLSGPTEVLDALEKTITPYAWQDDNFTGSSSVLFERTAPQNLIGKLRSDPQIVKQIKNVGVPLAVGLGGLGVVSLGTSAVSASAALAFNLAQFFRYIAFGFLRFKRRRPWGTVYNQATNKSVPGALVKLFDAQLKKLKETRITDRDGRFGFLISPGEYYVKVIRRGFQPQQTKTLRIDESKTLINIDISITAEMTGIKKVGRLIKILDELKRIIEFINPYILALGTILSLIILIILPTALNYIILAIYLALDVLKIFLTKEAVKSFGITKDQKTDRPLDLAIVRIFDANKNWLLNTKVTGSEGRFNFLTARGSYYLTAIRSGYESFHSKIFEVKKAGIANFDIKLKAAEK